MLGQPGRPRRTARRGHDARSRVGRAAAPCRRSRACVTRPVGVVQRGEQVGQRVQRVGHGAAEGAGVQVDGRPAQVDLASASPRMPMQALGTSAAEHAGVADDDDVAGQPVAPLAQQRGEVRRAGLLLALDQEACTVTAGVSRPVAARCARRPSRWNATLALVVGGAAGVQLGSPLDGRLERRVRPQLQRVDRLHVVVAVDERDRRVRRRPTATRRRPPGARRRPDLDGGEPGRRKRLGQPLGAAPHVRRVRRVGGDRRDPQPGVEVGVQVPVCLDEVPFRAHPGTRGRRDPTVTRRAPGRDRRPARWGDATRRRGPARRGGAHRLRRHRVPAGRRSGGGDQRHPGRHPGRAADRGPDTDAGQPAGAGRPAPALRDDVRGRAAAAAAGRRAGPGAGTGPDRLPQAVRLHGPAGRRPGPPGGRPELRRDPNPALVLHTDPPGGTATVSVVDISYLGYDRANLAGLDTPAGRRALLRAPLLPFDGMNQHGLRSAWRPRRAP